MPKGREEEVGTGGLGAWIGPVLEGRRLTEAEAESAFHALVSEEVPEVRIAAFLAALRARGETGSEVAGGVRALRRVMVEVELPADALVDTCGTGGGALTTFNISTVAALVAAGAGARVAKHGNRSFTSRCGSADLLEALGVAIDLGPGSQARLLERAGVTFMYAPRFHPAMGRVASVRRLLGVPTIMNLLGPLTSPARVRRQVVGVADPELVPLVADALRVLGHERALVVHGEPGLDELSPLGPSRGLRLQGGECEPFEVRPEDFGWSGFGPEELEGGSPEWNARLARRILEGGAPEGARAAVLLNAGAALWAAGLEEELRTAVQRAEAALEGGDALRTLERLRKVSRALAARDAAAAEGEGGGSDGTAGSREGAGADDGEEADDGVSA